MSDELRALRRRLDEQHMVTWAPTVMQGWLQQALLGNCPGVFGPNLGSLKGLQLTVDSYERRRRQCRHQGSVFLFLYSTYLPFGTLEKRINLLYTVSVR